MMMCTQKKNQGTKGGSRLLISVTVLGSAGPIRFIVYEQDVVATVIDTALKFYAREGRLPVLGSDLNDFSLYCPNAFSGDLSPWETIGSVGARNFMLYKKPQQMKMAVSEKPNTAIDCGGSLKTWIDQSFHFYISSHK